MMKMKEYNNRRKVIEHMKKLRSIRFKLIEVTHRQVYKINTKDGFEVTFKFEELKKQQEKI